MEVVERNPIDDSVIVVNFEEDDRVHEEATGLKRSIDRDSISGKLFVGGLSWETTEESFVNYFSQYGEITDSVIMMDKHTGRPRGFGFVTFADAAVADRVLEEEHVVDGRAVEVKKTVPREDMRGGNVVSRTKKIFVGGIPPSFTEDELREHFSSFGNIVEHQILVDSQTGRPRGFGFVTFETEDSVENIFAEGKTHELGGKQVEIKRAEPRRGGSDHGTGFRQRYSGGGGSGSADSYGGYNGGAAGYSGGYTSSGGYGAKMGGGYSGYGGYGGGYGGYAGGYGGGAAGFYGGFGFGYGGAMYGAGYASNGYGMPSAYDGAAGYGGSGGGGSGGGSRKGSGGRGGSTMGRYNPYGR